MCSPVDNCGTDYEQVSSCMVAIAHKHGVRLVRGHCAVDTFTPSECGY